MSAFFSSYTKEATNVAYMWKLETHFFTEGII